MSTAIWGFRFAVPFGSYSEGPSARLVSTPSESGTAFVRSLDAAARFVNRGTVRLDGSSGHAYSDWLTFLTARSWGADSFLFKPRIAAHREVASESIGTSSGGAGESFTLAKKFIDTAVLVVKVDGVEQAGARWSLSGNNTAPQIDTAANFDAGAVTAEYEFYRQVRLSGPFLPDIRTRDTDLTAEGFVDIPVSMREVKPGGYLV